MIKQHERKQLKEKRIVWSHIFRSQLIIKVRTGTQKRRPKPGTQAVVMEETDNCLVPHGFLSPAFYHPRSPAQAWSCPQCAGSSHINHQARKRLTSHSVKFSSSQMISACFRRTKKTSPHSMIIGKYYSVMKHLFVVKISLLYMKTEPKTTTRLLFMRLLQLFAHHLLIVIWLLT